MSGIDDVRINGNLYSWPSVIFKLDGQRIFGIKAISYGDKRERVYGYGQGRSHAPRGQSSGKYTPEPVAITWEKDTVRKTRAYLAAKSADGASFGNVKFQVTVQFVEPDGTPITDEIIDCKWAGNAAKNEESGDPTYEDSEFTCMRVKWDGKTLYDGTERQT